MSSPTIKVFILNLTIWRSGHLTNLDLWPSRHLDIWPSGHLVLWPSGHLDNWTSGHPDIWPFGLLAILTSDHLSQCLVNARIRTFLAYLVGYTNQISQHPPCVSKTIFIFRLWTPTTQIRHGSNYSKQQRLRIWPGKSTEQFAMENFWDAKKLLNR